MFIIRYKHFAVLHKVRIHILSKLINVTSEWLLVTPTEDTNIQCRSQSTSIPLDNRYEHRSNMSFIQEENA